MIQGFCILEQTDVEVGPDRRCLTDGSLVIAPSTACAHRMWINGAWSACLLDGQSKPCKPVVAGTWRAVLEQQARAVAKRERDRAARRFYQGAEGAVPKLRTAHKPAKVDRPPATPRYSAARPCAKCGNLFVTKPGSRGYCSVACGGMQRTLSDRACGGCGMAFRPRRAKTRFCSVRCSNGSRLAVAS